MSEDTSQHQRLNKHLALHMGVSRREADELIEKGSVAINGQRATLGARFNEGDSITVNGKP
jgi:16S rRNA U516 pseudouridylate synthase RsuA-like enzyme